MHVSRSRRRQLFRGDSFSALGRDSCICQWLFLQFKPNETELHPQYQNVFLCKFWVQSPHQGSRAPYQDCRLLSPPYTNKQDPRPFMKTHVLNGYQTSYQDFLNVVCHPTLYMGPVWKPLLLKCLNAWITSIPQVKDQGISSRAGCP